MEPLSGEGGYANGQLGLWLLGALERSGGDGRAGGSRPGGQCSATRVGELWQLREEMPMGRCPFRANAQEGKWLEVRVGSPQHEAVDESPGGCQHPGD